MSIWHAPVRRTVNSHERENEMRVMVMVKATADSEAGVMPGEQLLARATDTAAATAAIGA